MKSRGELGADRNKIPVPSIPSLKSISLSKKGSATNPKTSILELPLSQKVSELPSSKNLTGRALDHQTLGFYLNKLGTKESKRTKMVMSFEKLLEDQLIATLNKPPKRRTNEEISILEEHSLQKPFLKQFMLENGRNCLRELLTCCYHEFLPKGEVLFEVNRPGHEFYIILDGEVAFFTNLQKEHPEICQQITKRMQDAQEIPLEPNRPQRTKSSYQEVPKIEKILSTTVKMTSNEVFVLNDGRLLITFKECQCKK